MLGVTSGTVGSTLSRAHVAIRQRLEAEAGTTAAAAGAADPIDSKARREPAATPPEVLR